jgi:TolA-binding protein
VKSSRTAFPSVSLFVGILFVSLSLIPAVPEARTVTQRDQNRVVSEIRQLQVQLATLVETQTALSQAVERLLEDREEQLTADRRSRAETLNTLDRMERSVATLSEAFREVGERLSALMVEVESVREGQRRAALLGAPPETADDTEPSEEEDVAAEEASGEEDQGATVLDEPSVSEIYLAAQADYYQGRYDLALKGLEQVASLGGELADNARYLMGECLLAQDRLDPALEQFEIVIRDSPDRRMEGEAWYKKGLILGRMGHESDAREIFEDILNVFAGTPAARLAQRELDAMPPRDPGC